MPASARKKSAQPASLAPGGTVTCSATYTLSQADIVARPLPTRSTLFPYTTLFRSSSAQATETVSILQAPSISLSKTGTLHKDVVGPTDRADLGDTITYAY